MRRLCWMVLTVAVVTAPTGLGWAASDRAVQLRDRNALSEYLPPESFLAGNYVADDVDPTLIFGKVKDLVKTCSCPTTWLIDKEETKRREAADQQPGPLEYTLYLEEDCPQRVTYFVFVDRSQSVGAHWLDWRKQFHKNKAELQYGAAKASLDKAAEQGYTVQAELRFVEIDGELVLKKPEDILAVHLEMRPIYDLRQGRPVVE